MNMTPKVNMSDDIFPVMATFDDCRKLSDLTPECRKAIMITNRVLNYRSTPKSVIVTGSRMTGKTFMIRNLASHLNELPSTYDKRIIRVVRTTEFNNAYDDDIGNDKLKEYCKTLVTRRVNKLLVKTVLYTNSIAVASRLKKINPKVTIILEASYSDVSSLFNGDQSSASAYQQIDMDDFKPKLEEFINEIKKINTTRLEPVFKSHISDDMVEYFAKYIVKNNVLGFTQPDTPIRLKKTATVDMPIGFAIDLLETVHAKLLENDDAEPLTTKTMKHVMCEVKEEYPMFVTPDEMIESMAMSDLDDEFDSLLSDDIDSKPKKRKNKNIYPYKDVLHLADRLKKRIINQDEAIDKVCDALKIDAANLRQADGPIAAFVFQGPSGVGKTELAKSIAEEAFTSPAHFLRLDMSEYSEEHTVSRLIGSPPGYVGSEDGGQLTTEIEEHPQTVLLLDEAEKAHPKVWNMFLQVLDAGRLTDGKGNTVDFSKCIIILTTNLGNNESLKPASGFRVNDAATVDDGRKHTFEQAVSKYFLPEFVNRLDGIIVFNTLTRNDMERILCLQLAKLSKSLSTTRSGLSLNVDLTPDFENFLFARADFTKFGARELQRIIRKTITLPLSTWIIKTHPDPHVKQTIILSYNNKNSDIQFHIKTIGENDNGR